MAPRISIIFHGLRLPRFNPTRFLPHRFNSTGPDAVDSNGQKAIKLSNQPILQVINLAPSSNASGHIRLLKLNNVPTRNALSRELVEKLSAEIEAVHAQYDTDTGAEIHHKSWDELSWPPSTSFKDRMLGPTRALIIGSASDRVFCSGADLKERADFSAEETSAFLAKLRHTFNRIEALPVPAIAAVNTLAFGGGFELALACHLRVFSRDAQVGFPEVRRGIIPGAGGTHRLTKLVGIARARQMILTGQPILGTTAYSWGIAVHVAGPPRPPNSESKLPDMDADGESEAGKSQTIPQYLALTRKQTGEAALRIAKAICQGAPVAIRAALRAVSEKASPELEDQMYQRVVRTEDRNEGLQAFLEKRTPLFKGR